jgi:hypothetical protein
MTKKDFIESLSGFNDNDLIVIEIDSEKSYYDELYNIGIDVITNIQLDNGTIVNEIRLIPDNNF